MSFFMFILIIISDICFFSITLKDFMFPRLLPHQFLLAYVRPSVTSEAFQYDNPVNLATILNCRISESDPVFFLDPNPFPFSLILPAILSLA